MSASLVGSEMCIRDSLPIASSASGPAVGLRPLHPRHQSRGPRRWSPAVRPLAPEAQVVGFLGRRLR
eukprot:6085266-Alexandrium_andersonii.AAC.1